MAATTPAPASRAHRFVDAAAVIALVLLLAWQLAYWTWRFLAPPAASPARESRADVDLVAIARLFGGTAPSASAKSGPTSGLRLKGVIAPTPGVAASAIFSTGSGKDLAVYLGREVSPGVKLKEVHPAYVVLSRNGVDERIDLEAMRGGGTAATAGRERGFRLNVARSGENNYALSRKELDDALRDPNQLNYLGQIGVPPGGGVRMEAAPAGSLASKLGLRPGDVIRKVNGQSVASPGDLARLYQQFGTINSVTAEVQRGTSTVQLNYQIQ
jgi:type II secretory pathway component PulC